MKIKIPFLYIILLCSMIPLNGMNRGNIQQQINGLNQQLSNIAGNNLEQFIAHIPAISPETKKTETVLTFLLLIEELVQLYNQIQNDQQIERLLKLAETAYNNVWKYKPGFYSLQQFSEDDTPLKQVHQRLQNIKKNFEQYYQPSLPTSQRGAPTRQKRSDLVDISTLWN